MKYRLLKTVIVAPPVPNPMAETATQIANYPEVETEIASDKAETEELMRVKLENEYKPRPAALTAPV